MACNDRLRSAGSGEVPHGSRRNRASHSCEKLSASGVSAFVVDLHSTTRHVVQRRRPFRIDYRRACSFRSAFRSNKQANSLQFRDVRVECGWCPSNHACQLGDRNWSGRGYRVEDFVLDGRGERARMRGRVDEDRIPPLAFGESRVLLDVFRNSFIFWRKDERISKCALEDADPSPDRRCRWRLVA